MAINAGEGLSLDSFCRIMAEMAADATDARPLLSLDRNGMPRILESAMLTKMVEDWSEVRSPSRAMRRRRRGHPQRIRYIQRPNDVVYVFNGALVMHPDLAVRVRRNFPPLTPRLGPDGKPICTGGSSVGGGR